MHATILTKDQEQKWDEFAATHPYSSIHQTSSWAHFQSNVPSRDKFWIIALFEAQKVLAGTILIKHKLPRSKFCWLYAPRGPLLSYENQNIAQEQFAALLPKIKEIAKQEKAVFLRIDPLVIDPSTEAVQVTRSPGASPAHTPTFPNFAPSHLGFQPEDTLIIDLTKTPDEILSQMKEKGRYNIRLAQKKQLKIIEADPSDPKFFDKQIEQYFEILKETTSRDKFYGHGIGFYRNMVEKLAPIKHELKSIKHDPARAFSKDTTLIRENLKKGFAKLYLAEYVEPGNNGKPTSMGKSLHAEPTRAEKQEKQEKQGKRILAGIIITFHKDTAIYYYGASSGTNRNLMAPYLLQWHAMMEAKKFGCTKYDFLGIAPPTTKKHFLKPSTIDELGPAHHPWRGVTEFKRKFGGQHVKFLPAQELSFKPFTHSVYRALKHLRKIFK